jgi:hypothetical protein
MLPTKFRFIWPSGFGGEDFLKSVNQKQELPVAAMFVNRSEQNKQSLERTFHRCFLPSFSSFGWEFSEEKIKMWKVNGWRTPSDGKSSHCLWQGELKCYADMYNKSKYGHSNILEAIIYWTHCIMHICLLSLFQVLNMPSKYAKFRNLSHFQTPFFFINKTTIF